MSQCNRQETMTGDVSSNKQDEHQNQQSSSEMVLNQQERLEMGSDMKMEPEADSNIQSSAEVMKNQVSGYEIDSNNESTQKMAYSDESTLYLASNHESTSNLASSRESPFDLASDNDATPKMTSYQESEMGRFLRELLENHDEEHPSEPMLSPDELLEPSFFGYRDNAEDHFEEDLLDRTEPELAQTAPSPSLVARSLAKSLEERPLEGFNIHLTPFSLPDYYTLSTVGSSQRPDPPSTSSHATNLTNSRSPPSPIRTQPKRRYQRRGTVKLHNWNRSVSNDRSEDHHRPRALFDINDKLASPPNEPIYMNRSGVTRRISMRQKQAQSVIIMDEQSFSGDESSPSPHTMLKDARCGSLPSMNINSEGEETQDTNTWSSTYEKDNIGFSDPLVTSSIFRSDSNSNSIGDFQVLNIPNESDEYSSKVSSPVEEDNRPPHSAPPNMEDNTHFTFERRKSMIQELPAISEDLREEERPPSACSSTENDNTFHKRSTSDYILDKKEASPPLVKRNSIQETKDKPRLRIISGNPNGNGDHVDGKHETTMNKTYDLPYSPHEDKNMILKQNGSKKLHLVESQKRTDRDKKSGMSFTFWSIRHKKKLQKDARSTNSISPGRSDLDLKRASFAEFGAHMSPKVSDVLPDTLAKVLGSHNSSIDLRSLSEEEPINWPLLEKPKWEDLRIWDDIDDSWSSRHPTIHLPHSEAKRQNVIYELHATETRHCRVLIYLQQVFQAGLLIKKVLPPNDVKSIIPDVLDSLLDFHLQFLRRIRTRIAENPVVRTISDIVVDEFRNGENRAAAVNAYTEFCLASNEADKRYEDLMNKNSRFKLFIDEIDRNLVYSRSMNFKSCFLLVTQRLTKYPMLIEQILKYEEGEDKNLSLRACAAVKGFASRVDKELSTHMLNKRFDKIRNMIEKTSKGNLLDEEFTYDDLITSGDTYRKILSIGTVTWKSATHQSHELIMLLFDDIIVFLQGRNDVLYFFQQKDHASVLPLKATLVREMPRSNEVMLIVIDQKKPDMYRLSFNSKSEMTQWVHALKSANNNAPKFVRTASRLMFVEGSRSSTSQDNSNEESQYTEDLDKWHNELDKLYADRKNRDSKLEEYMEEHMQFLDGIREHVSKFPVRPTIENGSNSVRQKEMKEIVKMKNLLKAKFADLRTHRRAKFDKLIERAEKARDSDLPSYYDEVYELSHPGGFESATFSSSDENSPSTSERCRKPRRVRTYHGEEDSKHQNVRRHTTVPHVYDNEDETEAEKLIDQEIMRLPLKVNQKSRKAATDLIRENIRLRLENDRLRDENALTNIHLTALKARKNPFAETAEKLESLRQKQEEVQNKEVLFKKEYEKRMDALKMMEEELKAKEAELRQRELEMANNNQSFSSLPTESPASPIAESPRPDLNRETSFRLGAAILDNHKPTMIPRSTQSATDVVPRHLASKSETKLDKTKKKK